MTDRVDDLRELFSRLDGPAQFTESQQQPRGTIRPAAAVDRDLRRLIDDLRADGDVRTTLSDDDLVTVVRGFHAGRSDRDLAADLGITPETVFRARMALHLFADTDAPRELDPVLARLRAGDDAAEIVATLDVSRAAVDRVTRLLAARATARRVNYRYTTEFADLLDGDTARVDLDRQVWDDRRALVDVHDD
jgi:hypothetical protein